MKIRNNCISNVESTNL